MTVRDTPDLNGVAERMNRTLCELGQAMLFHAGLSKGFWAEAINTAGFIRNRLITSTTGETPYFRCFGKAADVSHLWVFGCTAYAHIPDEQCKKFDKKAEKLRFIGYAERQKAYRFWDQEKRKCVVRKDVVFNEIDFGQLSSIKFHEMEETNQNDKKEKEPSPQEKEPSPQEKEPSPQEKERPPQEKEQSPSLALLSLRENNAFNSWNSPDKVS